MSWTTARQAEQGSAQWCYQRRRPEQTLLYPSISIRIIISGSIEGRPDPGYGISNLQKLVVPYKSISTQ